MSTPDTTAANPYIVHGAALCVSRPVQTHPFLVQGWGMFDRSGHGIAKHHRHTVEWDSNEATWKSVEKELDDKYMEGGRSSNPLVYVQSLKQMYWDMKEAWKKLTLYQNDYKNANKKPTEHKKRAWYFADHNSPDYLKKHYEKHCRRFNALLKYFQSHNEEIWELIEMEEVKRGDGDNLRQIMQEIRGYEMRRDVDHHDHHDHHASHHQLRSFHYKPRT